MGVVGCTIPLLTTGQLVDPDGAFLPSQWAVDWMRAEVIFNFEGLVPSAELLRDQPCSGRVEGDYPSYN